MNRPDRASGGPDRHRQSGEIAWGYLSIDQPGGHNMNEFTARGENVGQSERGPIAVLFYHQSP